jgi:putative hydrolase of the HAD superfamily
MTVEQVAMLAIGAHGRQVDKIGVPYREHLRAVAEGLEPFGPMVVMAGWLHDIIEDTDWTAAGLREVGVSARVVAVVDHVTRREGESYPDMITRVAADPVATLVKIADNAHNSLPGRAGSLTDEPQRRRLEERYQGARRILWPAAARENVITIASRVNPALLAEMPPAKRLRPLTLNGAERLGPGVVVAQPPRDDPDDGEVRVQHPRAGEPRQVDLPVLLPLGAGQDVSQALHLHGDTLIPADDERDTRVYGDVVHFAGVGPSVEDDLAAAGCHQVHQGGLGVAGVIGGRDDAHPGFLDKLGELGRRHKIVWHAAEPTTTVTFMAVRAVVFDVGNVLELSEDNYVFDEWAAGLGLTPAEFAERTQAAWDGGDIGTVTLEEVHRGLGEALGIDDVQVNAIMESMWREYLGTANTELTRWARGLRPRYKTGILSNSFVGAREREQTAYGYMDFIDDLVYSHEVGLAKPDARIYLLSCERLGVQPGEAVFIDNHEPFVQAAQDVGMHAVHFTGDNAKAIAEVSALLAR